MATSNDGIIPVVSPALESGRVLLNRPGALFDLTCVIGATSGYVLVFDAVAVPGDGAGQAPKWFWPVTSNGTNGAVSAEWPAPAPLQFATGISVCFSTTGPYTKTASATAAFSAQVA